MVFKSIKTIARVMTLVVSFVIVGVALIAFNNVINEVQLSESDYNLEENQLITASDEIERNVDYYIENEQALFERNVTNELFYLVSYMEVKLGQELPNLNSFLHHKTVEDIQMLKDGQLTDFNPMVLLFEHMGEDELDYMIATLNNNLSVQPEGKFYYFWPSSNERFELDRKVIHYKSSNNGCVMMIGYNTMNYSNQIRADVTEWLESVYADEVLLYDLQQGRVLNEGIIENFNIERVIETSEIHDNKFIYEQDGTRTRIIYLSTIEDISVVFARELQITDYSNMIIMTLGDRKVLATIVVGVILIVIIKLLEYTWVRRVIDQQYFDKRFIYETLQFITDGVAVLDQRFVIEDCNDPFKSLLGLDVFIKDNYNLKKLIPEFRFAKEPYSLVFMNKKAKYVEGDFIVKKIEDKYIVKISVKSHDKLIQYMTFKDFREAVIQRMSDREGFVKNSLFAMISLDNEARLDDLMVRLRATFNAQGLIALTAELGSTERVCYIEGLGKNIFDNTLDNLLESGGYGRVDKVTYASIQYNEGVVPIDMDYIMEELDFKLYEKRRG